MSMTTFPIDRDEETESGWAPFGALSGLVSLTLVVALAWLAGRSVQEADWSDLALPVATLAAAAAVFGAVLARLRLPDSMAHFVSILVGLGTTLYLVLRQVPLVEDESGTSAQLRALLQGATDWYLGRDLDPLLESLLVTFLMGSILWLVGYLSAWCLFRRGWVFVTVVLPGFLMLVSVADNAQSPAWLLISYALVALLLLVRQNVRTRRNRWQVRGMEAPRAIGSGLILWGSLLAVLATVAGAIAPSSLSQETFQPLVEDAGSRFSSAQDAAESWIEGVTNGDSSSQVSLSGTFTAFNDSFAVGGPLELTDTPQALVFADRSPYLTAQTYDAYTGRGWYSTVEETFEAEGPNGRRYSPQMTFGPTQDVPITLESSTDRVSEAMEVTLLAPTNGRLLTVDAFRSASVASSIQLSWIQLDNVVFDVSEAAIVDLPRELQPIATFLVQGTFSASESDRERVLTDTGLQAEVVLQQAALRERFLDVAWTVGSDDRVATLIVTGQLPVYDDVEAVFARRDAEASGSYRVIAYTSEASDEALSTAGTDYPAWVADRYLTLPESVTTRTIERALEVTAPFDDPMAKANALEEYIRGLMIYDESVTAPPEDADIVDYLLFERQRGYCEYSASAMTVMLRAAGIPSRMVVGFSPGTYNDEQGGYLYLQRNAHAWTEAFFPGYGWIRFEPTPAIPLDGDLQADPADTSEIPIPTEVPEQDQVPTQEAVANASPTAEDSSDEATPIPPMPTEISGDSGRPVPWVPVGFLAGAAVVAGGAWYFWSKPLRGLAPSSGMYFRLRRLGAMLGVRNGSADTPREFGRVMAERLPEARPHIERIVKTYEVDQYGPEPASTPMREAATGAWNSIRRGVPRWLLPRRKRL